MALSRAEALPHMDTTNRMRAIAPAVGGGRWTVDAAPALECRLHIRRRSESRAGGTIRGLQPIQAT